jgi:signal transduction histidine kinase
MVDETRVTVLLVDDQPAKLLSYEAILAPLGESLVRAATAEEAMGILLRSTVAVMLVDVCMPGMDGFDLTELVRKHPRFRDTAILLVSGVQMGELDRLRGYESGAVDYIPVPIVPELLRAKVRVFVDLFRKSRRLQELTRGLERQVEERTRELQRSNEELQQFAYVASHDLQEPLRMVSSFVQLLGDRYGHALDAQGHEFVRFAVDGVQRMHQLIDDLLRYARLDRSELGDGVADCEKSLDAALANLRLAIEESGAEVQRGPLPRVRGDEVQIAQLLQNLIGNSLKFVRPGVPPRVRIEAEPRGREWLFAVRDNGIGVPASQAERIFELFQRLHARDEYTGTGIGLAVCRKLVHRHRGRIWLDPESAEGCTIRFALPVSLASDAFPPSLAAQEPRDDLLAPLAGASASNE